MVSEAPDDVGPLPVPGAGPPAQGPGASSSSKIGGAQTAGAQTRGTERAEEALPLRLALARGSLGIELNRSTRLGPLEVRDLAFSLPDLRYPLDLSKGVKQFRSRRGHLQRLVVQLPLQTLGDELEAPWRELLGETLLGVHAWKLPAGPVSDPLATAAMGLGIGLHSGSRSLAFDLLWCCQGDPVFVVDNARGVGIETSALALALRAVDLVAGSLQVRFAGVQRGVARRGRLLDLGDAAATLCRAVLPIYGCRVPATESMQAGALEVREGTVELVFDVDLQAPDPPREVLLALEAAYQLRTADDLLAEGEDDEARQAFLGALTLSSGLGPAARAVAELDVCVPGRQEAALAMLEEVGGAEASGALGSQALVAAGHVERAREALAGAAEAEPFGPLAAQLLCRAAQLAEHSARRVACLDRAVARAPQLASARWLRFEDRVRRGDVEGALADAQLLEASSTTLTARHGTCLRAGRRLAEAGHRAEARRFLEKALRYAPDDPAARAALGRLFAGLGMRGRALTLLQGALQAGASSGEGADADPGELSIDLARLLAEGLEDLPQAIARLRQVSVRSAWAVEARVLEAQYCERLGDATGAARAYARLREAAELGWAAGPKVLEALRRGAAFEERRGDLATAERHLYAALSMAPSDAELKADYRRLAALSSSSRS